MAAFGAYIPWILFGVMAFFGIVFAALAWSATRRRHAAEDAAEGAVARAAAAEQRAKAAEDALAALERRASSAEAQVSASERRAADAQRAARELEERAAAEARRAEEARQDALRADQELRERRDAASEMTRKAEARARSLLSWAKAEWEKRREPDRQKAQAVQGSFQAQLDAYLEHRRAPITFRADSEVDRLAAPIVVQIAEADQRVERDGDLVRVSFPVDPSLGFRA